MMLRRCLAYGPVFVVVLAVVACGGSSPDPTPADLTATPSMMLESSAFAAGETIPAEFSCDGNNVSPPLQWSDPPEGTQAYVLLVEDPDVASNTYDHWVLYDLPVDWRLLGIAVSPSGTLPKGTLEGKNSAGKVGYTGPCPPKGQTHHYRFRVYALDTPTGLDAGASKSDVLKAMQGHVLGYGELIGVFGR